MYEVRLLDPANELLESCSSKMQAKILRTIDLLERFGPNLPQPHAKNLTGYDLKELRVKLGSDIIRMFYFHHRDKVYIITSGYIKKSNKISKKEIKRALKLKAKFEEENK